MLEIKFEPKTEGFTGHMQVMAPSYVEKLRLMKELGFGMDEENKIDLSKFEKMSTLDKAEIVLTKAVPFIKSVHLKHGERVVDNVIMLEHYEEGLPVIMEVFTFLCQGLSLGKN